LHSFAGWQSGDVELYREPASGLPVRIETGAEGIHPQFRGLGNEDSGHAEAQAAGENHSEQEWKGFTAVESTERIAKRHAVRDSCVKRVSGAVCSAWKAYAEDGIFGGKRVEKTRSVRGWGRRS
jgi:hypothetical protein